MPYGESPSIVEVFSPKTTYHKIDSVSCNFLKDSILNQLSDIDYEDTNIPIPDGILTIITITDSENSVKSMDLSPATTANQKNLILNLIDITLESQTDSLNIDYLVDLKSYYAPLDH